MQSWTFHIFFQTCFSVNIFEQAIGPIVSYRLFKQPIYKNGLVFWIELANEACSQLIFFKAD